MDSTLNKATIVVIVSAAVVPCSPVTAAVTTGIFSFDLDSSEALARG